MKRIRLISAICLTVFFFINLLIDYGKGSAQEENQVWVESNFGLHAGVISDIVNYQEKNEMWASTIRGGIYLLKEKNNVWQAQTEGLTNWWVHSLMISPRGVFAGTEDFIFFYDSALFRWMPVDENLKQITVRDMLCFDFNHKTICLAGTNKGIYRSDDFGASWNYVPTGSNVYEITSFAHSPGSNNFVIASTLGKWVLISYDGGKTWSKASENPALTEIQTLYIDQTNPERWVAGTYQQGIIVSEDHASTWTRHNLQLDNLYVSKIWQHPQTNDWWISTYDGLYFSKNLKLEWEAFTRLPFNTQVNCFLWDEAKQQIIVGTQGDGMYRIHVSQTHWEPLSNGINNVHARMILNDNEGSFLFVGTWGSGIFRSGDLGKTWKRVNLGITNPFILCMEKNSKNEIFVGTFNGGLFKTSNLGENWERILSPTLYTRYIYSIAFDPLNESRFYVGSEQGIYRTVDNGSSWAKLGPGDIDQPTGEIFSIAINPRNYRNIIAATKITGMHISQDGGESWAPSNAGLSNYHITSVQFHPSQANTIYASSFGGGVLRSIDGGASWQEINQDLKNSFVYSIFMEKTRPDILYASTENGAYSTKFGSTQWTLFGTGLQRLSIRNIFVDTKRNLFIAASYGRGLFSMQNLPPPPKLSDPPNQAEIIMLRPTLSWVEPMSFEEPIRYQIQISHNNTFIPLLHAKDNIIGDQYILPDKTLEKYQAYYWRVRSETDLGHGPWSSTFVFYTIKMMILKINDPMMLIDQVKTEVDPGRGTSPIIRNQRTFMPIRAILEPTGGTLIWNPDACTVILKLKDTTIELTIDQAKALVNERETLIDPSDPRIVPFIHQGRTMLPLRFVAENLNYRVSWEASTQVITLIYPDKK